MNKLDAKKYLTKEEYEIWNRTQIKKKNDFVHIAKDLGVTKQAIQSKYTTIAYKLKRIEDMKVNKKIAGFNMNEYQRLYREENKKKLNEKSKEGMRKLRYKRKMEKIQQQRENPTGGIFVKKTKGFMMEFKTI